MRGEQRVGDHGDEEASPAEDREQADCLASVLSRRLLDDQGGRHAGDEGLEADRDQTEQREHSQRRRERAREVRQREPCDTNGYQSPAAKVICQRRQGQGAEGAQRQD